MCPIFSFLHYIYLQVYVNIASQTTCVLTKLFESEILVDKMYNTHHHQGMCMLRKNFLTFPTMLLSLSNHQSYPIPIPIIKRTERSKVVDIKRTYFYY